MSTMKNFLKKLYNSWEEWGYRMGNADPRIDGPTLEERLSKFKK